MPTNLVHTLQVLFQEVPDIYQLGFAEIGTMYAIRILCLLALFIPIHVANAITASVVMFKSQAGIILFDTKNNSKSAYHMFRDLNVPVQVRGMFTQTKIFAPKDGTMRIVCTSYSAYFICAVIVYPSKYAKLDFDTDSIKLDLPAEISKKYAGIFPEKDGKFVFQTKNGHLRMNWSREGGMHIENTPHAPGQKPKAPIDLDMIPGLGDKI